jgi:carbon monoxide dehydrogenase subunit G
MAVTVKIDLGYEFQVKGKAADVFEVLSDVPASVSHFPKVDKLTDLGDGVYRWEMEKVGTAQVNIQTVYASKYVSNRSKGTVVWTPVPGVGNALVGGQWKIKDNKAATAIELKIDGEITVPLPGLMKMVVAPVVESEFEKLVDQYIANLIQRFGGEAYAARVWPAPRAASG